MDRQSHAQTIRDFQGQFIEIGETSVFVTDAPAVFGSVAPHLPADQNAIRDAFSTGNRLTRQKDGAHNEVHAVSETVLSDPLLKVPFFVIFVTLW